MRTLSRSCRGLSSRLGAARLSLRAILGSIVPITIGFAASMAFAGTMLLSWVPPTQNTDNSPLTDLTAYKIYSGCSTSGQYTASVQTVAPTASYLLSGLPDFGTCYAAVTAISPKGESARSNEASKFFGPPPVPDTPVVGPAVTWSIRVVTELAADTFNRADNPDLSASWDVCTGESGSTGLEIVSNTARGTKAASNDSSETYNAVAAPNDGYAEITFGGAATGAGAGAGIGPTYRAATGATKTYYRLIGNGDGWEMGKKVAGVFTSLGTGTGTTFATGDVLRLELEGTTWRAKKNGVQFATGTDSSIASGRAGLAYSSTDGSTTADAWAMGSLDSGAIIGSATITFTPSGTMAGAGALGGSSTITFTPSGTAIGAGALAGTTTLTFTPSGTLTGAGALAGATTLTFTGTGTLAGAGALAGPATLTFTASGTLDLPSGAIAGAVTLTFTPTGALTGSGALVGATTVTFAPSGTLGGPGDVSGAATLAFAPSGAMRGDGALAGDSPFTFTPSGALVGAGAIDGGITLTFTLSGAMIDAAAPVVEINPIVGVAFLNVKTDEQEIAITGSKDSLFADRRVIH